MVRTSGSDSAARTATRNSTDGMAGAPGIGTSVPSAICWRTMGCGKMPMPPPSSAMSIIVRILLHRRSEEHTSELQSLMRISYAVFCLQKKKEHTKIKHSNQVLYQTIIQKHSINHILDSKHQ